MTARKQLDRWGPLDVDYFDNPKTLDLVLILGPRSEVFPPRMWTWAFKFVPNGVFKSTGQVEMACRWDGEPGLCAKALKDIGFLEKDGLTLHDWFAPGHFGDMRRRLDERRKQNRDYAAARRGSPKADGPDKKPEFGPKDEAVRQILQSMTQSNIPGKAALKREHIEAWMARGIKGERILEVVSKNQGRGVFELEKLLVNGAPVPFRAAPQKEKCPHSLFTVLDDKTDFQLLECRAEGCGHRWRKEKETRK